MDKVKKLLTNISIFGISQFASKILVFFMLPFYTAYLTTAEYGVSDMVFSMVNLFLPIFTIQIYSSVLRFVMEDIKNAKKYYFNGFFLVVVGFLVLLLLYPLLNYLDLFDGHTALFYLYYLVYAIYQLLSQFARGVQKIKHVGICGVVNTTVIVSCSVLFLAYFRMGVAGYILASIMGFIVSNVYFVIVLREYNSFSFKYFSKTDIVNMIKYSLPLAPNSLAWWGVSSANKVVIQQYLSNSVLGLYSAALRFPTIVNIVQSVVSEALVISILDGYDKDNPDVKYYSALYRLYSTISIFIVAIIIVLSKILAKMLLSADFIESWRFIPFLCIPPIWGGLAGFLGTFYAASKKNGGMFISTLIGAILTIIISVVGIRYFGVYAILVANIVVYFVIWLYRYIEVKKQIDIRDRLISDVISWGILLVLAVMSLTINGNLAIAYVVGVLSLIIVNYPVIKEICLNISKVVVKK